MRIEFKYFKAIKCRDWLKAIGYFFLAILPKVSGVHVPFFVDASIYSGRVNSGSGRCCRYTRICALIDTVRRKSINVELRIFDMTIAGKFIFVGKHEVSYTLGSTAYVSND